MRYRLSSDAARDLVSLTQYGIETFGQLQAQKYLQSLEHTFELLTEMPLIGREDAATPGRRRFPHGRHIILYRPEDSGIVISRILHASLDQAGDEV